MFSNEVFPLGYRLSLVVTSSETKAKKIKLQNSRNLRRIEFITQTDETFLSMSNYVSDKMSRWKIQRHNISHVGCRRSR